VLGHNDDPPIANLGSAIFIHIARPAYKPTEGCIAINEEDMLKLVPKLKPGMLIELSD